MYSNTSAFDASQRSSKNGPKDRVVNHFDAITRRYRDLYKRNWAGRSVDVKQAALARAITEKSTADYTQDVFYQEFARRVDLLLDSTHFCNAVKDCGLNDYNVATHIVVLGWKELENVLLHGGYKELKPYGEWKNAIIPRENLKPYLEPEKPKALPFHRYGTLPEYKHFD